VRAKVLGRLGRKPSPHSGACALSCPSRAIDGSGSFGISASFVCVIEDDSLPMPRRLRVICSPLRRSPARSSGKSGTGGPEVFENVFRRARPPCLRGAVISRRPPYAESITPAPLFGGVIPELLGVGEQDPTTFIEFSVYGAIVVLQDGERYRFRAVTTKDGPMCAGRGMPGQGIDLGLHRPGECLVAPFSASAT
jgi:hypothetical protein